jgi:hypothetical protein
MIEFILFAVVLFSVGVAILASRSENQGHATLLELLEQSRRAEKELLLMKQQKLVLELKLADATQERDELLAMNDDGISFYELALRIIAARAWKNGALEELAAKAASGAVITRDDTDLSRGDKNDRKWADIVKG